MQPAAAMQLCRGVSGHWVRRATEPLVVLTLYLALTLAMTYPVVLSLSKAIPIDLAIKGWYPGDGDPWQYLWAFWYFTRALAVFPPPFLWTNLVYFPIGFEMPFLPGVGVILILASLLQLLCNLTLAYNLLWLL